MHRNNYDTDVTVWSPEGRLLQVRSPSRALLGAILCLYVVLKIVAFELNRIVPRSRRGCLLMKAPPVLREWCGRGRSSVALSSDQSRRSRFPAIPLPLRLSTQWSQ